MMLGPVLAVLFQVTVEIPIVGGNVAEARSLAVDTALGQLVELAASKQGRVLSEVLRKQSRKFVDSYRLLDETERPGALVLTLEGDVSVGRLHRELRGPQEGSGGIASTYVDVAILGVHGPLVLSALRQALANRIAGVTSATFVRASRGRFEFRLWGAHLTQDVSDQLVGVPFDSFHLQRVSGTAVQLRVVSP